MKPEELAALREAIQFASTSQIAICFTAGVALFSIWRSGIQPRSEADPYQEIGVKWLGLGCLIWVVVGVLQLVLTLVYPNLEPFLSGPASWGKAMRQFLSIANSFCLLIAAAHFDYYGQGNRLAAFFCRGSLRGGPFWAVLAIIAMVEASVPPNWYIYPDIVLSLFTAVFLMWGLFGSFWGRGFHGAAIMCVPVFTLIVVAQVPEIAQYALIFGWWRWVIITVFKAGLCILFVVLTYSWIHKLVTVNVAKRGIVIEVNGPLVLEEVVQTITKAS